MNDFLLTAGSATTVSALLIWLGKKFLESLLEKAAELEKLKSKKLEDKIKDLEALTRSYQETVVILKSNLENIRGGLEKVKAGMEEVKINQSMSSVEIKNILRQSENLTKKIDESQIIELSKTLQMIKKR